MMRNIRGLIAVPALVIGAACAKNDSAKMDEALKSDLTTAAQAQPYQPQQFVSPMEQGYQPAGAQQQYVGQGTGYVAPAPAPVRTRTVYRDRPVYVSSGSGSSGSSTARAPQKTEKHGGRDAAIGAAAGAVIGATTSRDKVKGGVIGAAAGGILGAVIGNNVDIKKH
jgi:hypothetical protein